MSPAIKTATPQNPQLWGVAGDYVLVNFKGNPNKTWVLRAILADRERLTMKGKLAVHGSTSRRAEVGQRHQVLQVVSEAVRGVENSGEGFLIVPECGRRKVI